MFLKLKLFNVNIQVYASFTKSDLRLFKPTQDGI